MKGLSESGGRISTPYPIGYWRLLIISAILGLIVDLDDADLSTSQRELVFELQGEWHLRDLYNRSRRLAVHLFRGFPSLYWLHGSE